MAQGIINSIFIPLLLFILICFVCTLLRCYLRISFDRSQAELESIVFRIVIHTLAISVSPGFFHRVRVSNILTVSRSGNVNVEYISREAVAYY